MLGSEGRGVLSAVTPLLSRLLPAAHVVPVAAPVTLFLFTHMCVCVCVQHIYIPAHQQWHSLSPPFATLSLASPRVSSLLQILTLTARNCTSPLHAITPSITASFICPHLDSTPASLCRNISSLRSRITLKNLPSYSFFIAIVVPLFFSHLTWLSFLGSVVMRTSLSLSLYFYVALNKKKKLPWSTTDITRFLWSAVAQWQFVDICLRLIRFLSMMSSGANPGLAAPAASLQ